MFSFVAGWKVPDWIDVRRGDHSGSEAGAGLPVRALEEGDGQSGGRKDLETNFRDVRRRDSFLHGDQG